jgi:hypothetical protein
VFCLYEANEDIRILGKTLRENEMKMLKLKAQK